jgi:hypothetical protein
MVLLDALPVALDPPAGLQPRASRSERCRDLLVGLPPGSLRGDRVAKAGARAGGAGWQNNDRDQGEYHEQR